MAELNRRRRWIYWGDLIATASIAWAALLGGAAVAGAALPGATRGAAVAALFALAVLALNRATSFMHEVTHVRAAMPRFALAWDVLIGVPLLVPSLLYVGVHTVHHDHRIFGTDRDPEYVKHAGAGHLRHLRVVAQFALVPAFLVVRWLLLVPLSWAHAGSRRFVVARLSSFAGNPAYRRPTPKGADARRWRALEAASFVWTALVLGLVVWGLASDAVSLASLCFVGAIATCVSAMHGMRSLATHRFHGDGAQRTVEEQLIDSVNVTGHPLWTELWAPVGLRYHALHHLAPRLPYHSLGAAHRLLLATLAPDDVYRSVTFDGLADIVALVIASAERGTVPTERPS